ncbi:hypothetical protein BJX63DRAFT_420778 [Aspergillus granulosus]|uniref:Uncharacterized protein n=1 Tax=Aspergillus granulosus TaxID=176169 RepID=A0ABR4HG18_9EURO
MYSIGDGLVSKLLHNIFCIIILAFFLLYLFSVHHYQASSYCDPTSFFFDTSRAYKQQYSSKRVQEASAFISNTISVRRSGDQYVSLTVGSLLDSLSEPARRKMLLYLCIGNTNPVETLSNRLKYYNSGAKYIAILKDNTLAAKSWFPSTLHALETLYLHLFYINKLLMPTSFIWLVLFIFIPAAISLYFMAGRQTIWPLPPGSFVFPQDIVPRFLKHTNLTIDYHWVVVPPLLQYIGLVSSKEYRFNNSASKI